MLRQATSRIAQSPASFLSTVPPRAFTTVAARRAAGDAGSGASRAQGVAQGYVRNPTLSLFHVIIMSKPSNSNGTS